MARPTDNQAAPACTFVEVSRFIDPDWLVELELDAYVLGPSDWPSGARRRR